MKTQTRCIDCNAMGRSTDRPAYNPGPRCQEHWRAEKKRRAEVVHANRMVINFGISGEIYWGIYEFQGGCCYICRKATGKTKHLAVDHDHTLGCGHDPKVGCPKCIRALLCSRCNKLVAYLDAEALQRAIEVLKYPPAQQYLRQIDQSQIEAVPSRTKGRA